MMQDMEPEDINGNYVEKILIFNDGSRRKVLVTEKETPFQDGRLIVSRTDAAGIITHVNQSFVEMSGYSEEELVGQPHYILRHPDMPSAAFKCLWDTIEKGDKWHGYVKNLRKDGGYYWVLAVVIPNVREGRITGFTSVRRKPARRKVEECIETYPTLF
ncbi:MAG: PAS domain-containing protein [Candidatus Thiodiazotropha taylori]|nr:PAS domain-containing protein [Candidatus Thiodiazotropha taylori]